MRFMTRRKNIRITERFECGKLPSRKTGPAIKKARKAEQTKLARAAKKQRDMELALEQQKYERALAAEGGERDWSEPAIDAMISPSPWEMQEQEQKEWYQRMQEIDRKKAREEYEKLALEAAVGGSEQRAYERAKAEAEYRRLAGSMRSPVGKIIDQIRFTPTGMRPPASRAGTSTRHRAGIITHRPEEVMGPIEREVFEHGEPEPPEEMYQVSPLNYIPKRQRDRMKGIPDSGGFTENPGWRELLAYQGLFGGGLRKVPAVIRDSDKRLYIEQQLYNKTGVIIDWEEGLACGSFGCAFETDDVERVVKITEDVNEAPGGMAILASKRWWPGLIGVHHVFKWPGSEKVWILVMERVGTKGDDISFAQDPAVMRYMGFRSGGDSLTFKQLMESDYSLDGNIRKYLQRPAVIYVHHKKVPVGWPADPEKFWQQWMETFQTMFVRKWPQLKDMGETYAEFYERYGVVFPDIHIGNLGCRVYEDPESGLGPTCTRWTIKDQISNIMGPQLLCLDLGVSGGPGTKAMKKKRVPYLNPMLEGYMDYIPEL